MKNYKFFDKELLKQLDLRVFDNLKRVGFMLEGYIKKSMKTGSHLPYARGKKTHWSSKPGDPPAVDTGRLRASITVNYPGGLTRARITDPAVTSKPSDGVAVPQKTQGDNVVVVGTNVKYGYYLEIGTSRMAPRPFLRTALEDNKHKILNSFKNLLR